MVILFLYRAYADDSSFFFKIKNCVKEAFKVPDEFSFLLAKAKWRKVWISWYWCIDFKKAQGKISEFSVLKIKNLKMKRISKIVYRK